MTSPGLVGRGRRPSGLLAWTLFAVATVGMLASQSFLATHGLSWAVSQRHAAWTSVLDMLGYYAFAVVGLLLAVKRPGNPVGWLFLVLGTGMVVSVGADSYAAYAYDDAAGQAVGQIGLVAESATWMWALAAAVLPYALLLFPDGRPPSSRWRWVGYVSVLAGSVLVVVLVVATARDISSTARMDPGPGGALEAIGVAALVALTGCILGGAVSLIIRFRRSVGVERQQLRWIATAMVLFVLTFAATLLDALGSARVSLAVEVVGSLAFLAIPAAVGVAVLRFRLYDLDRVISRTVSYALLTVLLAGIYAMSVVGLATVGRTSADAETSDLVVAGSTLLVAAMFGPARKRIQRAVDHQFRRQGYDAARTIEDFGQRLRDEVDLDLIGDDLVDVAGAALQPSAVTLWLSRDPTS